MIFDQLIATARRLIVKFGETSNVIRTTSFEDPARPWEPPAVVKTPHPVPAAWIKRSIIRAESVAGDKEAFVILPSDFEPDPATDCITRANGDRYQILTVEAVDPNGQQIVYELKVKQ